MSKSIYYSSDEIRKLKATYSIIFGERSNGKTYDALKHGIDEFFKNGHAFAYVRRWRDEITGTLGGELFNGFIDNGYIEQVSGGKWNSVIYKSKKWYFAYVENDEKPVVDSVPFAYAFAVSSADHYKSMSFPAIYTIIFDEFLTRGRYIDGEFMMFMSIVSTIVRRRDDIKIFLLGNTVNQYCPYFLDMGIKDVKTMNPGEIRLYKYGNYTGLTVAVEYANTSKKSGGKKSDVYFAFDNPALEMITGGQWQMDIYPHLPEKFVPKDILFTYFIIFDNTIIQAEIVYKNGTIFTYLHRKTGEIKYPETDIVFTPEVRAGFNYNRNILKPTNKITKRIASTFNSDQVFYQDNSLGELIRNYLIWCRSN